MWTPSDRRWMRRAIRLSRRGYPAPNPPVGCVLVKGGEWIADGEPTYAGGPHAEAVALARAGERARGADVYVTLEPCDHYGRTPPCSLALIAAGVRRVVVGATDPNPLAAGGVARLRAAGIEVEVGLERERCEESHRAFRFAMMGRRPFVVAKAGASLDGRIALPSGESKWITGPLARREGHRLRARLGAVLVGWRTVAADDPLLTVRLPGVVNPPLRVVVDSHRRLTGRERVFGPEAETLWVTEWTDEAALLDDLFARGVTGLLIEGGGTTIARFLRAELVDRVELFLAPKVLGDGPAWVQGLDLPALADAPALGPWTVRRLGPDLHIGADVIRGERPAS